jgi:hypothetical protein
MNACNILWMAVVVAMLGPLAALTAAAATWPERIALDGITEQSGSA